MTNPLTTLALVTQELGVTGADDLLTDLIDQASDMIEDYCQRTFAQATQQDKVVAYGHSPILMLPRTPITAVSEVLIDSETITDYTIHDADAGFLYREAGWLYSGLYFTNLATFPIAGSEERNVWVTYTAGYTLPSSGSGYTLPKTLVRACNDLVKAIYFGRQRDPLLKSEKADDLYQATYYDIESVREGALPPSIAASLSMYRRID